MLKNPRFSAILSILGSCSDRFVPSGYSPPKNLTELFDAALKVPDLQAVELIGDWHISRENVKLIQSELTRTGLKVAAIIPNIFGHQKWGKGSFTAKDIETRKAAISETKTMMDIAAELKCDLINLWLGQDGYDYSFQADYIQEWDWLITGLRECADHRKDVKLSLEYKIKEPRVHLYVATMSKALLIEQEIDRENIGITVDVGHSLNCYENVAESIAILKKRGNKLFHLHLNDNYRLWDDDLMVGSIHIIEYLELLYWLEKIDYQGWYSFDQYPYREDGIKALQESILWIKGLQNLISKINTNNLERLIREGDPTEASSFLRRALLEL